MLVKDHADIIFGKECQPNGLYLSTVVIKMSCFRGINLLLIRALRQN